MTLEDKEELVKNLKGLKVKGSDSAAVKCFNAGVDASIEMIEQSYGSDQLVNLKYHVQYKGQTVYQGENGNR